MSLRRTLTLWPAVAMVIGGIVGSGIFMKPALMASLVRSPLLLLGVWIFAGVLSLLGALTNAEAAAMFPETGGLYVYLQKMYGEFVAFLYGWAAFAVFNTAGVASIAYVMATYTGYFIKLPVLAPAAEHLIHLYLPGIGNIYPLENISVKLCTITIVGVLTIINYRSSTAGGKLQSIFTWLKVGAMGLLIIGLLFSSEGSVQNIITPSSTIHISGWTMVMAIVAATSGAFWGYDGWMNVTFVAGEIINPQKNIPRAMLIGLTGTILLYALINLAFIYILPIDEIAASPLVAADAATKAFGWIGGGLIASMVILSTLGTTHGNVFATARVSFAMARQKQFFDWVGQVHPRYQTPGNALVIHFLWTSMLIFSGSFDMLTDMLVFVSWLFYGLSAFGIFILRYKMPATDRPYRVAGYPFVPGIFVTAAMAFLILTVWNDVDRYLAGESPLINSLFGVLLTALGVPLYWYFAKRRVQRTEGFS